MKGLIALDIDGTITVDHCPVEQEVISFLGQLYREGWRFVFITGRTFAWGHAVLKPFDFPYHMAVQNGAIIMDMPACQVVSKKYLKSDIIPALEDICRGRPSDFIVYTGYENSDLCYYRPAYFSTNLLEYLDRRSKAFNEKWIALDSFAALPVEEFPSVKCFGFEQEMNGIALRIEEQLGLHAPPIKDPFDRQWYVAQATHPQVSKGMALNNLSALIANTGPTIAAGDDNNDKSMLEEASIKVAMATAPKDILALAQIIAPPASEKGIIKGLTEAVRAAEDRLGD